MMPPLRCAEFRIRSMAAPASMSPADAVGLAGVVDLLGDASFAGSGAGFLQPAATRASIRHANAIWLLLTSRCRFMGTRTVTRIAGRTILVVVEKAKSRLHA